MINAENEIWVRIWNCAGDDTELEAITTITDIRKNLDDTGAPGDRLADEILANGTAKQTGGLGDGYLYERIEGELDRSYELNISYWNRDDLDLDDSLDHFAQKAGFARTGSGAGFGARDLHYQHSDKPSDDEIAGLRKELNHLTDIRARICVWGDDGQCQLENETITIKSE